MSERQPVLELLEYWENLSGHRPVLEVTLGEPIAPSKYASFPAGLSSQRSMVVRVHLRPATRYGQFSEQLLKAITESYQELSADYYRLGAAHARASIAKRRIDSLREIREMNREMSNAGLTSWTEVVYLDSLINTQLELWSSNKVDISALSPLFAESPLLRHIVTGRPCVWSNSDFWKFYPKPPAPPESAGTSADLLYAQFASLSNLRAAIAQRGAMSALRKQINSDPTMGDEALPASNEVLSASRAKECDARLAYLETLLKLPPPMEVVFSLLQPPSPPSPPSSPPPPAQLEEQCSSNPLLLKITGIIILAAGMMAILRMHPPRGNGTVS